MAVIEYPKANKLLTQRYSTYLDQIQAMFDCKWVGNFEYMPDGVARFNFILPRRETTLTNTTTHRIRHVHDIVRPESHELPAPEIARPARVDELIRLVQENIPELYPYLRIITGLEIVKGEHYEGADTERTWVGKMIDGGKAAAAKTAEAAKNAAQLTGKALTSKAAMVAGGAAATGATVWGLATLLGHALAVVAADPALTLGEKVLYGWD